MIPVKFQHLLKRLASEEFQSFDFSNSDIGDQGVAYLSVLISKRQSISILKLNFCKITDDGLAILCRSLSKLVIEK
jgi:hypothetical protein